MAITFDDPDADALSEAVAQAVHRETSRWTHAARSYRDGLRPSDYDRGHPWFYYLGGQPCSPHAIEPSAHATVTILAASVHQMPIDRLESAFYSFKRFQNLAALLARIKEVKNEVAKEITRYHALCAYGIKFEWRAPWINDLKLDLAQALASAHNHICYHKGEVRFLNQLLCTHHLSKLATKKKPISSPKSSPRKSSRPAKKKPSPKRSKSSSAKSNFP